MHNLANLVLPTVYRGIPYQLVLYRPAISHSVYEWVRCSFPKKETQILTFEILELKMKRPTRSVTSSSLSGCALRQEANPLFSLKY